MGIPGEYEGILRRGSALDRPGVLRKGSALEQAPQGRPILRLFARNQPHTPLGLLLDPTAGSRQIASPCERGSPVNQPQSGWDGVYSGKAMEVASCALSMVWG
jgi:hypothetical protein